MLIEVKPTDYVNIVYARLSKGGVFLTANGSSLNTMTIGWGGITHFWAKPVFIVPVRQSRHTYPIIKAAGEFSVSVPIEANVKKELAFCGSKSGRDGDKFAACSLKTRPGKYINTPIITQCELHFECKTLYTQDMDPKDLDPQIDERWYPDYHTLFFGEIVGCYLLNKN